MACIDKQEKTFTELQDELLVLQYEMFPDKFVDIFPPPKEVTDGIMSQVLEEAGEVQGAIRNFRGRKFKPNQTGKICDIAEEIGDVLGVFICLCEIYNLTPETCLKVLITKLRKRKTEFEDAQRREDERIQLGNELVRTGLLNAVMPDGEGVTIQLNHE